jgi:hypothetical protein
MTNIHVDIEIVLCRDFFVFVSYFEAEIYSPFSFLIVMGL